jgi:tetratricopeptide (TPR) repeat protein
VIGRLLAVMLAGTLLVAARPVPVELPPLEFAPLVPFARAAFDKPAVPIADPPLPEIAAPLPALPATPLVLPAAQRPLPVEQISRRFPCDVDTFISPFFGRYRPLFECGIERFQAAHYSHAVQFFERAALGGDRAPLYWLGESYLRLNRPADADKFFWQAAQGPDHAYVPWALNASGWTALRLNNIAGARRTFEQLLAKPVWHVLDVWGRHGLALALYRDGDPARAAGFWSALAQLPVGVAGALERDIMFWHGATLLDVGQPAPAAQALTRFVDGGPHPLLTAARFRLAWAHLRAERPRESVAAFRAYLAEAADRAPIADRDAAQAGLALALVGAGDRASAVRAAAALDPRTSRYRQAVLLGLTQAALEGRRADEARALVQELLGDELTTPVRAWLLVVKADFDRTAGDRDTARTHYELARSVGGITPVGQYATFMLGRTNFDLRQLPQARAVLAPLLAGPVEPALRAPTLVLEGEVAYQSGDHAAAVRAFRRALDEVRARVDVPAVRLGLAWALLRQGDVEAARREFLEFARDLPGDPRSADALVLVAEAALDAGSLDDARGLLERVIRDYPGHVRTELARLNRAILLIRARAHREAQPELRDWVARNAFSPLLGRAHVALGVAALGSGDLAHAGQAFQRARTEGVGAVAELGVGAVALARQQWEEAARHLTTARDTGTTAVTREAAYGLVVGTFHRGALEEFRPAAVALVDATPGSPRAPRLLYAVTALAVEQRDWAVALAAARRLVAEYPTDPASDDALERVGAGAAAAGAWRDAHAAYALLRERYAGSPFVETSRATFARALLELGRPADAAREFEAVVAAAPGDGASWLLLGRARQASGDRRGALDAFERARTAGATAWTRDDTFTHARLLAEERRWADSRGVLEPALRGAEPAVAAQAALAIGETHRAEGESLLAAEYFMSAAYLAPASPAGRQALLEAARSLVAANEREAAAIVYRKLLAESDVPPDLAEAARRGLAEVTR